MATPAQIRKRNRLQRMGPGELFRTHDYGPGDTILGTSFPDTDRLCTFYAQIRVTDPNPTGIVFCLGDAFDAVALYLDVNQITVRAGRTGLNAAIATYTAPAASLPLARFDLTVGIRPGSGRIRLWNGFLELARGEASSGTMPEGWSASVDGIYAAAAPGALPGDVSQVGAPLNFQAEQRLGVYFDSVPRRMAL